MSHVGDGILHAYLDGALELLSDAGELPDGATAAEVLSHLRACADCRARLEAERAIREGAGILLGDAAPAPGATPPLPAALAAAPARRRARWVPLSWAATVLLAVGGGWWGSELWRAQGMATAFEQAEPRSPVTSAADSGGAPSTAASMDRIATERAAASSTAAAGAEADPRPGLSLAGESPSAAPRAAAPAQPLSAEPRVANAPAAPPPLVAAAGDRPVAAVESRVSTSRIEEDARSPRVVPVQPVMTPAAAARSLESGRVSASGMAIEPLGMGGAALKAFTADVTYTASFDSISARAQSGRIAFQAASASELRRISAPVFVVADASEPAVEMAHEGVQTIVRVRQTLQTGEELELISWQRHAAAPALGQEAIALNDIVAGAALREARPTDAQRRTRTAELQAASAAALAATGLERVAGVRTLADGRHQIVLRNASGDVWIALQSGVSAAELDALVARLRQPPR